MDNVVSINMYHKLYGMNATQQSLMRMSNMSYNGEMAMAYFESNYSPYYSN